MTKFEDQLYQELVTEHGHHLDAVPQPTPARRRVRRPVWLAAGAAGAAAAATAAVMALGSTPALAAYSVTQHNGVVTVAVNRPSGVAGANTTLHAIGARVVVVPVRAGCTPMGSLPHPQPARTRRCRSPPGYPGAGIARSRSRWARAGSPPGTR